MKLIIACLRARIERYHFFRTCGGGSTTIGAVFHLGFWVFGSAAVAEAFPEYDFSDLTAKQIKKLSNYGAILDRLSPDQIAEVLAHKEYSPDGRAVIILPKKRDMPRNKTVRYTLDPNGK